ncbi:CMPK2 [Branchiostoma lanceolatum]|uniref:UMP-CMP kinase 2, mitochondrial n=1 Tax=Branchiostoma lanceolatum TaxID=7740 RepID=A0A8K0A3B0_BRALA|nr:CMPK2 [Branchiostoma lanceolatum]
MSVGAFPSRFVRYSLRKPCNICYKPPQTCRRRFGSKFKMAEDQDKKLVHAIETESGPIYFSRATQISQKDAASFSTPKEFPDFAVFYSVSAYRSKNPRVNDIRANSRLLGDIGNNLGPEHALLHGFSFIPEQPDTFRKQFFILSPTVNEPLNRFVREMAVKFGQPEYFEHVLTEGKLLQTRVEVSDGGTRHEEEEMMTVEPPPCHPAFLHPDNNAVFHSYNRAMNILRECPDVEGVSELLSVASALVPGTFNVASLQEKCEHPVIVLEGLDATGKTTLTERLGKMLSAPVLQSPPPPIRHLREVFDSQPELIRRAYYTLGNYILAMQVAAEAQTRPVVIDRFWHSTTAYSIATEVGCGDESQLPPRGHHVYTWPSDLLKPHLAMLLMVNEASRGARLEGRGMGKTKEEIRLEKSVLFRKRLVEAYLRLENPSLQVVNASGSKEEVFASTVQVLKDFNILRD